MMGRRWASEAVRPLLILSRADGEGPPAKWRRGSFASLRTRIRSSIENDHRAAASCLNAVQRSRRHDEPSAGIHGDAFFVDDQIDLTTRDVESLRVIMTFF